MRQQEKQAITILLTTLCSLVCIFSCIISSISTEEKVQSSSNNPIHFFHSESYKSLPKKDRYFFRVAFGSEHGSRDQRIKKWQENIRLKLDKNISLKDKFIVQKVVYELNQLLNHAIRIEITNSNNYNAELIITDNKLFKRYIAHSNPKANGYVSVWYNHKNIINKSKILISSQLGRQKKAHVIREELTQSLGILKDSYMYKNSIFYQGHSKRTRFSKEDQKVIKTLYHPEILPGMTREDALHAIL